MSSLWTDGRAESASRPDEVAGVRTADVVVVGAGITGLTTALLLSRAGKKVVVTQQGSNSQCDAKKCTGSSGSELETALQFRVRQAHRCYDNALAQDPTLRGKVTVAVRIGANGQVCSAGIASNEMSSQQVAQCVSGYFRGANFPSPKGGCVDVNIPINFVPRQ